MIVEEIYSWLEASFRQSILDASLMLHEGAITSTKNERIAGLAERSCSAGLKKGDTILISSVMYQQCTHRRSSTQKHRAYGCLRDPLAASKRLNSRHSRG